jgi:hypothetical protein
MFKKIKALFGLFKKTSNLSLDDFSDSNIKNKSSDVNLPTGSITYHSSSTSDSFNPLEKSFQLPTEESMKKTLQSTKKEIFKIVLILFCIILLSVVGLLILFKVLGV